MKDQVMQFQPQLVVFDGEIAKIELVLENPFFEALPVEIGLSNLQFFKETQAEASEESEEQAGDSPSAKLSGSSS